jgi:hypothetical protein
MNVTKVAALAGLIGVVTGCSSGSKVDIGDGSTSQGLSAYAASWDGYAEAHRFGDGSDRVRITLDGNGDGHIRLGDSPLLAAPSPGDPAPPWDVPTEVDFAYPIEARLEASRLRFELGLEQRYQVWCELQTPVLYSPEYPGVYACARSIGIEYGADGQCTLLDTNETVDCNSHLACQGWCACSEESCTAAVGGPVAPEPDPRRPVDNTFDGALSADEDELVGTLVFGEKRIAVRLHRE